LTGESEVFIGLGSNLGESAAILEAAALALKPFLAGLRVSSIYRTKPRDLADQPDFLNMAATGICGLSPYRLLAVLQRIEARFGRDRKTGREKGPRSLDLDILLFGDIRMDAPRLAIPHPRLAERKFALLPVLELAPGAAWPGTGRSLASSLLDLGNQGIYYSSLRRYSLSHSDERSS
jgi:2-amino-4-hydroxy-6-hydroxymethyldihydropteridine diphosphokinase